MRSEDSARIDADDPLAELTRLIESFDAPDANRTVVSLASRRPGAMQRPPQEPQPSAAPVVEHEPEDDELRGSLEEIADEIHEGQGDSFESYVEEDPAAESEELLGMSPRAASEPPRRRWLLRSVALIALGVGGLGYYFYTHGALPGVAKAPPPTILASTAPVKVPPPGTEASDASEDTAPVLRKAQPPGTTAPKVVDSTEQPVDVKVTLAVQPPPAAPSPAQSSDGPKIVQNAPDTVALAPAPAPSAEAAPAAASASPSVPAAEASPAPTSAAQPLAAAPSRSLAAGPQPSPLAAVSAAPGAAIANPPAPQFPAPTKQRSVVIRPDGSLVADAKPDVAPPAASPSPLAKAAADLTAGQAAAAGSTPKPDLPTKLNGKSQERVSSSKPVAATPAGAGAPMQLGPAAADKTASIAAAAPAPVAPKPVAPADVTPPAPSAGAVASTTPSNPSADAEAKTGGWAAQLGAPRSQAEADATIAKLQAKYADALDGASLSIHKADVNGDTVYRVRAVGLTKDEAAAICSKVHAAGGGCFLARN